MRIAQVSPLYESVPPKTYGGTERVVSYLTEALVEAGHDVTLFASGDSTTAARLISVCQQSLRLSPDVVDPLVYHYLSIERALRPEERFDIVHFHVDFLHYPISRRAHVPHVTTLHGRLDMPELEQLYAEFNDMPVIAISASQRTPLPDARWIATIHHGLPADLYGFNEAPGEYLAFLGRISPEKGLPQAIEIAGRLGMRLKVAAKIDRADHEYFETTIAPLLDRPHVEFLGEIGQDQKRPFLCGASALLSPVDWPEPFGLVLIEALACGTPVIAFNRGSIPEIIDDGETGFIVENVEEAVEAARALPRISRRACRKAFELRFSAARMMDDYLNVYEELLAGEGFGTMDTVAASG